MNPMGDMKVAVAIGAIPGYEVYRKFGHNDTVSGHRSTAGTAYNSISLHYRIEQQPRRRPRHRCLVCHGRGTRARLRDTIRGS
jgi:hypothetical protein